MEELSAIKQETFSTEVAFDFESISEEVFHTHTSTVNPKWEEYLTEEGQYDVNAAWVDFVEEVRLAMEDYIQKPPTEMKENWVKAYANYFFREGYEAYTQAVNEGKQVNFSSKAMEQFTVLFEDYVSKLANNQRELTETEKENQRKVRELIQSKDKKGLSAYLQEGIDHYLNSDVFKNYLEFVSKFHKYSTKNIQLIQSQNPLASRVASFKKWKELERQVKKGSKAIWIYAPRLKDKKDVNGEVIKDSNNEPIKETYFVLVPVFDVSQTVGSKELPQPIYCLSENMENKEEFLQLYFSLKTFSPVPVSIEPIENGSNGYYHLSDKRIVIKEGMGEQMTIKTLIHEITHAKLHANSQAVFGDSCYRRQEFEAESVAYIVSKYYGIDSSEYSFGYLSSWTNKGKQLESFVSSLEMITKQAKEFITEIDELLQKSYTKDSTKNKFEERVTKAKEKNCSQIQSKQEKEQSPKVKSPHL